MRHGRTLLLQKIAPRALPQWMLVKILPIQDLRSRERAIIGLENTVQERLQFQLLGLFTGLEIAWNHLPSMARDQLWLNSEEPNEKRHQGRCPFCTA